MMNMSFPLTLAALMAAQSHAQTPTPTPSIPTLDGTVAIGAGIGVQRYDGTFGDQNAVYGRGIMSYHPLEWLGTRVTGGYGNLTNSNDASPSLKTEWFSNIGLALVLQPQMGLGPLRPYLASGASVLFGTAVVEGRAKHDLDWKLFVPVEFGLEYLIANNLTVWAWAETHAYMQDEGMFDGVKTEGSFFERRDELQKAGIGFSFLVGSRSDADGDKVVDGIDQCPGTPKGIEVNAKGCPFDADQDGVPDYKDVCKSTDQGARVDAYGCALDSDKDGVNDNSDKCPGTPSGRDVDVNGCPLAAADTDRDGVSDTFDKCPGTTVGTKVDLAGCTRDSDNDGVNDDLDKCANTPAGLKVDTKGCLLPMADADHDGISDALDKCPGTRMGSKVDTNGCIEIVLIKGAKLVIDGIVFKTGSAEIDDVSSMILAKAAVAISKAPDARIVIAGYTDNVGSARSNQKLSELRAASVKSYLVKSGVPYSQMSSKGYGETEPIVDNQTIENRADNRRIEFHVQ